MPENRRRFDAEFREGAVRIVRETGKPIAQVARDLGVNAGTLGNWVDKDRAAREGTEGLSTGTLCTANQGKEPVLFVRSWRVRQDLCAGYSLFAFTTVAAMFNRKLTMSTGEATRRPSTTSNTRETGMSRNAKSRRTQTAVGTGSRHLRRPRVLTRSCLPER
jgi:transposase